MFLFLFHSLAEQYKKAAIISYSGCSQAADLLSKAFMSAGDGLIELRRLEAAEEIATTLSRSRNVAYFPGGGQSLSSSGNSQAADLLSKAFMSAGDGLILEEAKE